MNLIAIAIIGFVVLGILWYLLYKFFIYRTDKMMDEYEKAIDKVIKDAFQPFHDLVDKLNEKKGKQNARS